MTQQAITLAVIYAISGVTEAYLQHNNGPDLEWTSINLFPPLLSKFKLTSLPRVQLPKTSMVWLA